MVVDTEIFEELFTLTRDFERKFRDQGIAGISTTQFQALSILVRGEPVTAMHMAERLQIAGPTATRTLDSLERRQLIVKERDPQDRRVIWLRLTERGVLAFRQEQVRQQEWIESLLEPLTSEERHTLRNLIKKLTDRVDVIQ